MVANFKKIGVLLLVLSALAAFGFYFLQNKPIAPETTFTTIKGEQITLRALQGKMVLVSFWASDCRSCVKEMPELINTYKAYNKKGFEVIAVAMPYDPPAQLVNFVKQKQLPFPVVHDTFGKAVAAFGHVYATPTAFLLDKHGIRIDKTTGMLNFAHLRATLDKELRDKELG